MTLPASGLITIGQIATEFGGTAPHYLSEYYLGGGRVTGNNTGVPTSGAIFLSQFYGTSNIQFTSGAWDQGNPGTYTLNVGPRQWIRMRVWGAGGGGAYGATDPYRGGNGGTSVVNGYLQATGGVGGTASTASGTLQPIPGGGGSGSGGNQQNLAGAAGSGMNGGAGAAGGAGGGPGGGGGWPGGGGGGRQLIGLQGGGGGGGGGFAHSYFPGIDYGTLSLTITVGVGGTAVSGAGIGASGRVLIEWG